MDEYLVFRENGEWYVARSDGGFMKGFYKATANQFTVRTADSEEKVYDYRIQDNQMRVYQTGIEYYRSGEPGSFVLSMDGASMNDTLNNGDFVTFAFPDNKPIRRFDIVANYYPNRGDTIFIKRVVGLPGDTVELKDGYLVVNGEIYIEPYINDEYRSGRLNSFKAYTVPEGKYFVMGDHRNNSNDSRSVGPLDEEMIVGVAIAVNGEAIEREETGEGASEYADDSIDEAMRILYPLKYKEEIVRQARAYNLDPALIAAFIFNETGFESEADSSASARGLMQLMPDTAEWIAGEMNIQDFSLDRLYDPETNIMFGCWYLNHIREAINDDVATMAAAYQMGEGWVKTYLSVTPDDPDWKSRTVDAEKMNDGPSKSYIRRIVNAYGIYRDLYDWEE